jgi:hypothetical protein
MAEFFGRIFGLTATLISALIMLLVVALLARYGMLGDVARALLALVLLPVKLVDFLITMGNEAVRGGLFSGGAGVPPTTT